MSLQVTTEYCTSIGSEAFHANALLNGIEATRPSVMVYFKYKKTADALWTTTEEQTQEGVGSFACVVDGLEPLTSYDIVAVANDGETTVEGATVTIVTINGLRDRTVGNYDALMVKNIEILSKELEESRITTANYAQILLSSMNSTMQLSYQMGVKEATIDENEILLQKQIQQAQEEILLARTRREQLIASVKWNNFNHGVDAFGDVIGRSLAGSVKLESNILQSFFDLVAKQTDETMDLTVSSSYATAL